MLTRGIKTLDLMDGTVLHFWYANNKGRGTNNCTIIKSKEKKRARFSKNQKEVVAKVTTSAWNGTVNFSKIVKEYLGM